MHFLVLFLAPVSVIEDWSKLDPEKRQPAEEKMRAAWNAWMAQKGQHIRGLQAAGKTKRASREGVSETKNDVMLFGFVDASSHEEAAALFVDHPHLTIPEASIEVMEIRDLSGM